MSYLNSWKRSVPGRVCIKVLRWKYASCVKEIARKLLWLEQNQRKECWKMQPEK